MPTSVFSQLDKSLHEHLSDLMRLAAKADDRTAVGLARAELPRMVSALKALLDEHQPDENGRCPTCRAARAELHPHAGLPVVTLAAFVAVLLALAAILQSLAR